MRKLTLFFGALLLASMTLSSCGGSGSMESDAQKAADFTCQAMDLMEKAMAGDEEAKAEAEKLQNEMKPFLEEMEAKYTSDEDKAAFKTAVEEATKDCK